MVKWNAFLPGLCATALVLGVGAGGALADVTTEKGASILIFPKVEVAASRDTIIHIVNTGNAMVHAHCNYVDASLVSVIDGSPCGVPSLTCVPLWQETDFDIWLTKQQPTQWSVRNGRRVDPLDGFGKPGSGFDPGLVIPIDSFSGELRCVETDDSGAPVAGNHLIGVATLKDGNQDVAKYNAVGILGDPNVAPSNPLLLDGNTYDACPEKLILNAHAAGTSDLLVPAAAVTTELTLVPCSVDYENQRPTSTTVQFLVYNEFEERFSASTTVTCFLSTQLTSIDSPLDPTRSVFSKNVLGTDALMAEITPVVNNGAVVGLAERRVNGGARSINNIHTMGNLVPANGPDSMTLTLQ